MQVGRIASPSFVSLCFTQANACFVHFELTKHSWIETERPASSLSLSLPFSHLGQSERAKGHEMDEEDIEDDAHELDGHQNVIAVLHLQAAEWISVYRRPT